MLTRNSDKHSRVLSAATINRRMALERSFATSAILVGSALGISGQQASAASPQGASTKAARFRALLQNGPFYSPLVETVLETRLAELAGIKHVTLSGNAAARAVGAPDLGMVSVTEVINLARIICDNTDLPLLCDLDDGDGTALNVYRWVQLAERAGAAGILVEDGGRHTHLGAPHASMVTKNEMVDKIKAALDARRDGDFIVLAGSVGMRESRSEQEALERGLAYAETGADMLWFSGMPAGGSTKKAAMLAKKPLLGLQMGDLQHLEEAGITMGVDYGAQDCALGAIRIAFAELSRSGATQKTSSQLALSPEIVNELLGVQETNERARIYNIL